MRCSCLDDRVGRGAGGQRRGTEGRRRHGCPCRVHRCSGGDAGTSDRNRQLARWHGCGAGAVRLGAIDPRRCAAARAGVDDEPRAMQRRRARSAGCCGRSRFQGQRLPVPVLHSAEPRLSGRLRQSGQPVHDDRQRDRSQQRDHPCRQHLVQRRQSQRWRPRDRRRRLLVHLGGRCGSRPSRRFQPQQRSPGPQLVEREDPARRALDR